MNKSDFIAKVAEKSGLTKAAATKATAAFLEAVAGALAADDKVQLIGFGTFQNKHRAARQGRNPSSGAVIEIPASVVPAFVAGKALKDAVAAAVKPDKKEEPKAEEVKPAPSPEKKAAPAKGGKPVAKGGKGKKGKKGKK